MDQYKRNGRRIGREAAGLVADYSDLKRRTPPSGRDRLALGILRHAVKPEVTETGRQYRVKPRSLVKVGSPVCTKGHFQFPSEIQEGCVRCRSTN